MSKERKETLCFEGGEALGQFPREVMDDPSQQVSKTKLYAFF